MSGPSGWALEMTANIMWTCEMICAACQTSDAATQATLEVAEVAHLILSGELPRETYLIDGSLIGLQAPNGGVRPIAISEVWYGFAGIWPLRVYGGRIGWGLAPLEVGWAPQAAQKR